MNQKKKNHGKLNYFKKQIPKCRSLTLEQIYGVPNNQTAENERQEIRSDGEAFLEQLKEIGCLQRRKKGR
jgi:hypothetical protein